MLSGRIDSHRCGAEINPEARDEDSPARGGAGLHPMPASASYVMQHFDASLHQAHTWTD